MLFIGSPIDQRDPVSFREDGKPTKLFHGVATAEFLSILLTKLRPQP